jgi:drug/metabolite transporter (DMT)-like permease
VSALLAWILLAEPLTGVQMLGGAVVLAGIALARHGSAR